MPTNRPTHSDKCRWLLTQLGLEFVRVEPATGWYRTGRHSEAYRWHWYGFWKGRLINGGCAATMTECIAARGLKFNDKMDEVFPA